MNVNELNNIWEMKENFANSPMIYIYGAGVYGQLFLKQLYKDEIFTKVKFVVSKKSEANKTILGIDVNFAGEVDLNAEKSIVVIAGGATNTADILKGIDCGCVYVFTDEFREQLKKGESKEQVRKNDYFAEEVILKECYKKVCALEERLERIENCLIYMK